MKHRDANITSLECSLAAKTGICIIDTTYVVQLS